MTSLIPAKQWTVEQVAHWMSVLPPDLRQYKELFSKNHVNGHILFNLTWGVLHDEFKIESYGHCTQLLEKIRNIQRSTDFPPLASAVLATPKQKHNTKYVLRIVFTYLHDCKRKSFRLLVDAELPEANKWISHVNFVLSQQTVSLQANESISQYSPPFEFYGHSDSSEKATLSCEVHLKQSEFSRGHYRRIEQIDGVDRRTTITLHVLPKAAAADKIRSILPVVEANHVGVPSPSVEHVILASPRIPKLPDPRPSITTPSSISPAAPLSGGWRQTGSGSRFGESTIISDVS